QVLILLLLPPTPSEISPLSLHDALPIYDHPLRHLRRDERREHAHLGCPDGEQDHQQRRPVQFPDRQPRHHVPVARALWPKPNEEDRKSTRLNSSHSQISYAVFCLKKKKK